MSRARAEVRAALLALAWLSPSVSFAEETPEDELAENPQNVVFADLSMGVLGVAYEHAFVSDMAIQAAAQYYKPWYVSDDVFGVGGQLRFVYFFTGVAPEGLYMSPGFRLYWASQQNVDDPPTGLAASWGATLGYSLMLWDALVLRLGAGPQVHVVDIVGGRDEPDFLGLFPVVDIFAGYAF